MHHCNFCTLHLAVSDIVVENLIAASLFVVESQVPYLKFSGQHALLRISAKLTSLDGTQTHTSSHNEQSMLFLNLKHYKDISRCTISRCVTNLPKTHIMAIIFVKFVLGASSKSHFTVSKSTCKIIAH